MKAKLIITLLIELLIGSLLGGILAPAIVAADYDYQIYRLLKKIQKDVDEIEDNTHRLMIIMLNQ
jgi:type III secretory pathway component EscU